jgi:ribosomal protein S18 acetylase RimI-like enzyme
VIDARLVADLVNAAYRGAGGRLGWTHEAELIAGDRTNANGVAEMLNEGSTTVLIRRDDKSRALLGCVAVELNDTDRCTISMLAVDPDTQRAGLGRALLTDAEDLAAEKGARIAKMTVVRQREALITWYERRGYRRSGTLEAFPYGDDSVGRPRRADLGFVVLEKIL